MYLSGTGNALVAARWFADQARGQGMTADIISIDRLRMLPETPSGEGTLMGFFYPTHGFSLPWHMLKFMLAFPVSRVPVGASTRRVPAFQLLLCRALSHAPAILAQVSGTGRHRQGF